MNSSESDSESDSDSDSDSGSSSDCESNDQYDKYSEFDYDFDSESDSDSDYSESEFNYRRKSAVRTYNAQLNNRGIWFPVYQFEFDNTRDVGIIIASHGLIKFTSGDGNCQYHSLIRRAIPLYIQARPGQRLRVVDWVVQSVRDANPPGRFVDVTHRHSLYNDIGDRAACVMTNNILEYSAERHMRNNQQRAAQVATYYATTALWAASALSAAESAASESAAATNLPSPQKRVRFDIGL